MSPHFDPDYIQFPNGNSNGTSYRDTEPEPFAYLDNFLETFTSGAHTSEASTPQAQPTPPSLNGASQTESNSGSNSDHVNGGFTGDAEDEPLEPIAIVGLAFQFPGGIVTEDAFWDMMTERKCLSSDFPADRINIDAFYSEDDKKKNTVRLQHQIKLTKTLTHLDTYTESALSKR